VQLSVVAPLLVAGIAAVSPAVVLLAAQDGSRIDLSALGPQVGERVPDFQLADQAGAVRTLDSIMGPRGAMLVFIRSADW